VATAQFEEVVVSAEFDGVNGPRRISASQGRRSQGRRAEDALDPCVEGENAARGVIWPLKCQRTYEMATDALNTVQRAN
jgi:hypothetical protein